MTEANEKSYPGISQSWGIVGISVLSMLFFSPVHLLLNPVVGTEASFFLYYVLSTAAPLYFAHWMRKKRSGMSEYNFQPTSAKIMVLVSIAVIAIQTGIVTPLVGLIPVPEFMKSVFLELAGRNGVFSFFALVIAAPVVEELIFRGIILDGLLKNYSPVKSIVVSSVLFGIIHLNPWQFVAAFVIGIFSGWIYYKTRNLALCILIHVVNNLTAFIGMSLTDTETMLDKSFLESYGGLLNMLMITLGAIAVGAISIHYLRTEVNKLLLTSPAPLEREV